jgi:hypothetical protein
VRAAQTYVVPVFTIASALMDLAAGNDQFSHLPDRAQTAARKEWGALLDASPEMHLHNGQPYGRKVTNR